jgi:uncharacterized membrane protein YgcG
MNPVKIAMALVFVASSLLAPRLRADVPPPDACTAEGAACDNAGRRGNLPGHCLATTCTRATADGGMQYDCLLCIVDSGSAGAAGAADAGAAGGASNGGASSGGASNGGASNGGASSGGTSSGGSNDDSGCSCRIGVLSSEKTVTGVMLGIGLAALALSRRRRR